MDDFVTQFSPQTMSLEPGYPISTHREKESSVKTLASIEITPASEVLEEKNFIYKYQAESM